MASSPTVLLPINAICGKIVSYETPDPLVLDKSAAHGVIDVLGCLFTIN